MPTAPTIVQLKYNWSIDRASAPVVAIIAHNTVGTDSRAYLSRGGDKPDGSDRQVSIHSLIRKDGVLYRYVPDERGANHAGFGKMPDGFPKINPNRCTIGFELENASDGRAHVDPYTDDQLLTMGWEINRIRAKFGPLPIFRHAQIDPDRRLDTVGLTIAQMEQWANAAAVVYGFGTPVPTMPPPTKRYRVRGLPVYERSDRTGPQWGCLKQDDIIEVDDPRNGHVATVNGQPAAIGFIRFDPDTLEAV
jgi:N-acetylmuramoyl-L-alanine amidase